MYTTSVFINEAESNHLEDLIEKRAALENLTRINEKNRLVVNEELYQKFLTEYKNTLVDYDQYWDVLLEKYGLKDEPGMHFSLDFKTREITSVPD